jgi:hypothetical protein
MPAVVAIETRVCELCGDEFDRDDGFWCDFCFDYRCGDCGSCTCVGDDGDDGGGGDDRVREWNYQPCKFRPKGDYLTSPLLGVELEVGGLRTLDIEAAPC